MPAATTLRSMSARGPHLELKNLRKTFRQRDGHTVCAVDHLSLAVGAGELLVIAGPSGCGKTTTLRLIAGLETPDAGQIQLDGRVLNAVPAAQRDVALVFQGQALLPHLSAFDNLALGLRLRNTPRIEIERRVRDTAELLGITACLSRRPRDLSGGEQQRVALGRALVRRPKLFLLDEPLSHLDEAIRRELRGQIAGLPALLGVPVIVVTHDQSDAMTLGHRLAILRDGVLQQIGRPLAVYRQPATVFVAAFLGAPPMNLLPGELFAESGALIWRRSHGPASGAEELHLAVPAEKAAPMRDFVGRKILAGLRPEHLEILGGASVRVEGSVPASLRGIESLGSETLVRVELAGLEVIARAGASFEGIAGQQVLLQINPSQACFFDPAAGGALV